MVRFLSAHRIMKIRSILSIGVAFSLIYFVCGIYVLRYQLDSLLFPQSSPSITTTAPVFQRISSNGNVMLIRKYGIARVGCVLFFPGQHGSSIAYETDLFPVFTSQGVAVLAVAYPGQDGAPGRANLQEVQTLASRAVVTARTACAGHNVVIYGRSLGSMVAAYSADKQHPAGLILEGAAPSLSSAIQLKLESHWYLAPLTLLPISRLLTHDYSLGEAMTSSPDVPTIAFQGTSDGQTPLLALKSIALPKNIQLIAVPGGTHSSTYVVARVQIVQDVMSMLLKTRT